MNFLASDIPSTDSEDGDYEPPTGSGDKPGALTLHKKRKGFAPDDGEWATDDDDDSDDDDDAPLEFDEEDVREQARLLKQFEDMRNGAGPSTAGAGPSSAGASSSGAGPSSSYVAGSSSSGTGPSSSGAGPSSSGAGPSSSGVAPSSSGAGPSSSGAGPSSSGASPAPIAVVASAASAAPASAKAATPAAALSSTSPSVPSQSANHVPSAPAPLPQTVSKAPASETKSSRSAIEPAAAVNNADEIRPVKKPRTDADPLAEPSPQDTSENKKPPSSVDDIWAQMNASTTKAAAKPKASATDPSLMGWLSQPAQKPAPARPFKVKLLGDLEQEAKARQEEEAATMSASKAAAPRATGLEAALNIVRGPKKDSVLTKTKEVWTEFKGKDEEVVDELEKYKKDKNRYTDKVAFLERSDVREWEYEQEGKRKRR